MYRNVYNLMRQHGNKKINTLTSIIEEVTMREDINWKRESRKGVALVDSVRHSQTMGLGLQTTSTSYTMLINSPNTYILIQVCSTMTGQDGDPLATSVECIKIQTLHVFYNFYFRLQSSAYLL